MSFRRQLNIYPFKLVCIHGCLASNQRLMSWYRLYTIEFAYTLCVLVPEDVDAFFNVTCCFVL